MKRKILTKRVKIRIFSFIFAVFAAMSVWGTTQTVKAMRYAEELSVTHQRTVAALSSYIDTLETDLQKMQYVNTVTMTSGLALSLSKASAGAKTCLSELNSGDTELATINKFLTQAGDYVQMINKKITAGKELSQEDRDGLTALYEYAAKLSDQISYMAEVMLAGEIDFEDAVSTLSQITDLGDLSISYTGAVTDAEKSFADYPTLIYDGPFADNVINRESVLLKGEKEISSSEAKKRAAAFSGIEENKLIAMEETKGTVPAFRFYYEGTTVAVTKNGGFLLYLLTDSFAGEKSINEEEAVRIAKNYLQEVGYLSMKDTYYYTSDGICTVNFAFTLNGSVCYSDLVKVSVSLDKGTVTSVDATGYIMNHIARQIPDNIISEADAREKVSEILTVKSGKTSFIPMEDGNEVFTYEFLCNDKEGNDVLVYINAKTGLEADLKLLLYSDGGTLTR